VPELDADSAAALTEQEGPDQRRPEDGTAAKGRTAPVQPAPTTHLHEPTAVIEHAGDSDPLAALLAALRGAGPRGAKVAELAHTVGRAKTWVYERLQDLHRQGQVERAGHGRWRIRTGLNNDDEDSR
jgi:hypothetical protein